MKKLFALTEKYISVKVDYDLVLILDELYMESRYPGELGLLPNGKPTSEDAKKFYNFAIFVYEAVKKELEI